MKIKAANPSPPSLTPHPRAFLLRAAARWFDELARKLRRKARGESPVYRGEIEFCEWALKEFPGRPIPPLR